jgi:hypothetical protein
MMQVETRRQGYFHTIIMILGTAATYYVTGRLGLLYAIPPGYATAIWLPSGIALGAILIGGYRVWPGILLGNADFQITEQDAQGQIVLATRRPEYQEPLRAVVGCVQLLQQWHRDQLDIRAQELIAHVVAG